MELKTLKIKPETHKMLKAMRGYDGCVSIDDVLKKLIKFYKEKQDED